MCLRSGSAFCCCCKLFWLFIGVVGFLSGVQTASELLPSDSRIGVLAIAFALGLLGVVVDRCQPGKSSSAFRSGSHRSLCHRPRYFRRPDSIPTASTSNSCDLSWALDLVGSKESCVEASSSPSFALPGMSHVRFDHCHGQRDRTLS
jgi:hypothetical protein